VFAGGGYDTSGLNGHDWVICAERCFVFLISVIMMSRYPLFYFIFFTGRREDAEGGGERSGGLCICQ